MIGSDETFRHVPTKIVSMNGKKFAAIHSLSNSIYALIWNPVSFVDVENHWSKDALNNMASRMIISGTGNGMFEPEKFISIAEFAAIIVRALGIELEQGTVPFSDGGQIADWANNDVAVTLEAGIVNVGAAGALKSKSLITRAEVATMIERLLKKSGLI